MKNLFRLASSALLICLVAACASGPGYKDIEASIVDVEPGNGRIFIYRSSSLGAAVQPSVRVNDEVVGKAQPKGFFYIDRPAGTYRVETSTEAERSLALVLAEGEEKYVRLDVKMGFFVGHIKPVLVEPTEGFADIQDLKYIGD